MLAALPHAIADWAVLLILVAAVLAIAAVTIQAMGVKIPPWVVTILWVLAAAFVGVLAIKFLVAMLLRSLTRAV